MADYLDRAKKLFQTANEGLVTYEQAQLLFETFSNLVAGLKRQLNTVAYEADGKIKARIAGFSSTLQSLETRLSRASTEGDARVLITVRRELAIQIDALQALIPEIPAPFDPTELQNQIDVLMAYETPKLDAIEARDALETLEGDERLDASAIKNLPEFVQEKTKGFIGPLALSLLADVAAAGIVAGQVLQWDGIKWTPYTPAGSGGTPVWGEDLTSQGPGTSFTLANTPIAGTVRLFRGGAYQSVTNNDYSIAGDTITLATTLQDGEVLVADYSS